MKPVLQFEEPTLMMKLDKLSRLDRAAFATACAGRLQEAYAKFAMRTGRGDSAAFTAILGTLWNDLAGGKADSETDQLVEESMRLIPQEDENEWALDQAAAEDAGSALTYALRCRRSGSVMDAVWAARRAYEALDQYVINHENIDPNLPGSEVLVAAHGLIQAELKRQQRDLNELLHGMIDAAGLKERSKVEAITFLPY